MTLFYRLSYRLSQLGALVAGIALIAMVAHIGLEIFMRHFLSTSTFVLDEFVGYGLMICTIWALGYTLEHESMIRVSVLTQRLPHHVQRGLLGVWAFLTAPCVAGLAWVFIQRADRAWERGTTSYSVAKVPMVLPESLMAIGLAIFALQLVAYGLRQISGHAGCAAIDRDAFVE